MATQVGNVLVTVQYSQNQQQFNQVLNSVRSIGTQGAQMTTAMTAGFNNVTTQMRATNGALSGLMTGFKAFLGLGIITGLTKIASKAIDLGSDMEEVSNVVSVTFKDMAWQIDEFSTKTVNAFGMSSTAAKEYAGIIGGLLGSTGKTTEEISHMSQTLVGLSGDLASFRNLSSDEAFGKVKAALTGETEPLKAIGIEMNNVNLDLFTMSEGYDTLYSKMSAADKKMVRINFLMRETQLAHGDYIRTSDGWANSIRSLSMSFNETLAVWGQSLITILTPIVRILDVLVQGLNRAGVAFGNFISKITGKPLEEFGASASSVVPESMFDSAEDGFKGVQDASGKTAAKIKKDQKSLASFDSIIKLNEPADSSSGSGASSGGASSGLGSTIDFNDFGYNLDELLASSKTTTNSITKMFSGMGTKVNKVLKSLGIEPLNLEFDFKFIGESAWRSVKNIIDTLKTVGLLVLEIGVKLWNDVDAVGVIQGVISTFEKATKVIKTAVDAITPGLIAFYDTALAPIITWLGGAFKKIVDWLGVQFDKISAWFVENQPLITEFLTNVGELIGWIWGILEPIFDILLKEVLNIGGIVMDWVLKVLTFVMKTFNNLVNFVEAVFAGDLDSAFGIVGAIFEDVKQFIHDTFEGVKGILQSVVDFVVGVFNHSIDTGFGLAKQFVSNFADKLGIDLSFVIEILDNVASFVKDSFANSFKIATGLISTILEGLKNSISGQIEGVKQIFRGIIDFITGVFTLDFKKALGGLGDIFGGFGQSFASVIVGPLKAFVKAWNGIADKLGRIEIPDWVGAMSPILKGASFSLNKLPEPSLKMADGGVVKGISGRGVWATIGEAGAEAVVPLENSHFLDTFAKNIAREIRGTSTSSGSSLTVNIDKAFGDDRSMRGLAKALMRELELSGYRVGGAY
jgi:phage-related protein